MLKWREDWRMSSLRETRARAVMESNVTGVKMAVQ